MKDRGNAAAELEGAASCRWRVEGEEGFPEKTWLGREERDRATEEGYIVGYRRRSEGSGFVRGGAD